MGVEDGTRLSVDPAMSSHRNRTGQLCFSRPRNPVPRSELNLVEFRGAPESNRPSRSWADRPLPMAASTPAVLDVEAVTRCGFDSRLPSTPRWLGGHPECELGAPLGSNGTHSGN